MSDEIEAQHEAGCLLNILERALLFEERYPGELTGLIHAEALIPPSAARYQDASALFRSSSGPHPQGRGKTPYEHQQIRRVCASPPLESQSGFGFGARRAAVVMAKALGRSCGNIVQGTLEPTAAQRHAPRGTPLLSTTATH